MPTPTIEDGAVGDDLGGDDGDAVDEPRPEPPAGPELAPVGLRSVPRFVWALTVLYGIWMAMSSVLTPLFVAPDEYVHVDLALALADDPHYPGHDERHTGIPILRIVPRYFADDIRNPDLARADAPPKSERRDVHTLGGMAGTPTSKLNQQPQHPPLYYQAMAVVVRVERFLVPGESPPALTTEVAILRLVNALLLLVVPWAGWAAARRFGADRHAALAAAALAVMVPQMTHIGSVVNNDNLLVALGAVLTVLLAGVAHGDRRPRTLVLVALVTGAALLTKAFAVLLLPWIAVTFLVGARRRQLAGASPWPMVLAGAASGLGAAVVSGWWWIGNQIREGRFAPSLEDTLLPTREGFTPDAGEYWRRFGAFFVERFWGWFGNYSARLPLVVIVIASGVLLLLLLTGLAFPGGRLRRVDTAVLLLPPVAVFAFVAEHAWGLHARTGAYPFIQGRYLFAAIVPLTLIAAAGLRTVARRWAPLVAVVSVIALHVVGFATMLDQFWGAPGEGWRAEVRAMVAWSAWTADLLVAGTVGGGLVGLAAVAVVVREAVLARRARPDEGETAPMIGASGAVPTGGRRLRWSDARADRPDRAGRRAAGR